ncbi:MAG: ABC transporter permease [Chloroflexota bacterium]
MRAILAVYKRELSLYFRSPIAYAVAFAMYGFIGLLFVANVIQAVNINLQAAQAQQQFGAPQSVAASLLFNAPNLFTFLMFLIGPLLTMRLIAEENREGTLEVLMTLPMNESAFIIGKFMAVWTYFTVMVAVVSGVQVAILESIGNMDYGILWTNLLGVWLYGGAALAICLIWSAVTEDQIVSAFLGSATILVLYLSDAFAIYINNLNATGTNEGLDVLANFFRQIGLNVHFQTGLATGLVRAQDIAYYVLMIIAAVFITTRLVEIRRWRG